MLKYLLFAGAIACALFPAESQARHASSQCVETGTVTFPICGMVQPFPDLGRSGQATRQAADI